MNHTPIGGQAIRHIRHRRVAKKNGILNTKSLSIFTERLLQINTFYYAPIKAL